MTLQEQIEIIARYDGWELMGKSTSGKDVFEHPTLGMHASESYFDQYALHIGWLHPVAMKVLAEFHSHKEWIENPTVEIVEKLTGITQSCSLPPINGKYIDLLSAVADGIEFLNDKK